MQIIVVMVRTTPKTASGDVRPVLEHCQPRAAGDHVILGVHFEPQPVRGTSERLPEVLGL
jgi:hypothetical protein